MKNRLAVLYTMTLLLSGCIKNSDSPQCIPTEVKTTAPAAEVNSLKGFLTGNGITAVEDPRGFFYKIANAGSTIKPNSCSIITFSYVGKLTDGTTIDSNTDVTYALRSLIIGWQEGLPLIGEGGSITLYLPPTLAYGATANGNVPANSNLIFTIDLKAVN